MPNLLDLPDEALEAVLLCNIGGRTLHQLTRVNKRLRRIANPILVQRWPYSHERLLLYLLHHPELRTEVKELKFENLVTFRCHTYGRDISDESLEALAATVDEAWPALAKSTKWAEFVRKGNTDALCTLLLCWATKLSSLDIAVPYFLAERREDFLTLQLVGQVVQMWKKTGSTDLPLLKLRSVTYRHGEDTDYGCDGRYAAPFFHLPNMKSFTGFKFGMMEWDDNYNRNYTDSILGRVRMVNPHDKYLMHFPIGTSPIEEIILDDVDLSARTLSRVVSACKRLKMLVYRAAPVCDNLRLSWRGFANVMLHHKKSLEILLIDFERPGDSLVFSDNEGPQADELSSDNHGHDFDPEVGTIYLRDCYQHLKCLKSLSLDARSLEYGHGDDHIMASRLPGSLVHLRLQGYCFGTLWKRSIQQAEEQIQDLEILVRECCPDGKLPNLCQITVAERLPKDPVLEAFDRLVDLAKVRGVKVIWIKPWEEGWEGIEWRED
ncbi:hypothetical protein BHE90_008685 [Fusarium euwallaceae]|uniref:F-box domain-containing protein n=1 Tax=Fusarium euwallaceae TaxID=1147111 RepID=A0A430LM63_9HYPO|nr:hypothetical protein BHE90_008685 [Fusarium euwallaceae]